jgi:hypothetical protein
MDEKGPICGYKTQELSLLFGSYGLWDLKPILFFQTKEKVDVEAP